MAQDDLIFKEKAAFKPAQITAAYTPVQAPDITPQMEKNRDILSKNMKDHADAVKKQLDAENLTKKLAADANVQAISKFSDTLTGLVKMGGEMWQEAEEREIEMWALNNTTELLKSITKTNVNEAKAIEGQVAASTVASQAEENGASSEVVQKLRDMGGFRKVHAIKVLLMQAGLRYPQYANSVEAREIYLPRFEDDDPNKKQIGTFNLISAAALGPSYVAQIENEIEKRYLAKFKDFGTLAMRHDYLFKKVKEYRDNKLIANAQELELKTASDQKAHINNVIAVAANSGVEQFQTELQTLLTIRSADNLSGGFRQAALELLTGFVKQVEAGIINPDQAQLIRDTAQIKDHSSGKMVLLKDHPVLKQILGELKFDEVLHNAIVGPAKRASERRIADALNLEKDYLEKRIPEMIKANKGPLTNQDRLVLQSQWEADPNGGGAGQPFPESIKTYITIEDSDDISARKLGWALIKQNNGRVMTELQASRLPYHIREEFREKNLINDDLTASDTQISKARNRLSGLWNADNDSGIASITVSGANVDRDKYIDRGEARFKEIYAELRAVMPEDKALSQALIQLEKEKADFHISEPIGSSSKYVTKITETRQAIKTNSTTGTSPNFVTKIDGLEKDIEKLIEMSQGKNIGALPSIFHEATRSMKMADGSNAAWAFARAQYKAYTGKDLFMPDGVTLVRNNTTLSTDDKTTLNVNPNLGGVNRVIIKSETNSGEPSDDPHVSTMTQSDLFDIITGSRGDVANNVNIYNNEENNQGSNYTIGNLADLQEDSTQTQNGLLGQFQLTGRQIRDAAAEMGINLDTELTVELEQKLWLNRVRKRLENNHNKFNGLVKKFPALKTLSKEELKRWKTLIKGNEGWIVDSPFNRAENLNVKLCFAGEQKRYLK